MVGEVKIKRLFVPLLVNEGRLSSSNMTAGVSCLALINTYSPLHTRYDMRVLIYKI